MAIESEVQYVSDAEGHPTAVIVPIELWNEIASERETAYLLRSDAMKERLLAARKGAQRITLKEARAKLGI